MQISEHPSVEILRQLGGNRFVTMTGAKDFVSADNPQPRLLMRLPANLTPKRSTHMEISLLPTDEYMLVLFKLGRGNRKLERDITSVERGIQVAQLREAFTRMTGLDTSL